MKKQIAPNYYDLHYKVDKDEWPYLVRAWSNTYEEGGTVIKFERYPIIRYTPCGCWITEYGHERFVNLRGGKQFAYVKQEDALYSLKRRKMRQLLILNRQRANAMATLRLIKEEKLTDIPESSILQNSDFYFS